MVSLNPIHFSFVTTLSLYPEEPLFGGVTKGEGTWFLKGGSEFN